MRILAACGLHKGEWDLVWPICNKITEDGRAGAAVRDAMELEYHSTACVFLLLRQLVTNVKELKFG